MQLKKDILDTVNHDWEGAEAAWDSAMSPACQKVDKMHVADMLMDLGVRNKG
jgi:hypothetical protein